MENKENVIKKVCSFYVNEWHLTTMMLPHINENLIKNVKVITLLEKGIKNNVEELVSKMNLKESIKSQILEINWTSNVKYKYKEIEKYLKENLKKQDNIEIIINGKNSYIDIINSNIEEFINKNQKKLKNKYITIINCYEVTQFNNISEVIDKHDLILNTSGYRKIEEVFTDYKKEELAN